MLKHLLRHLSLLMLSLEHTKTQNIAFFTFAILYSSRLEHANFACMQEMSKIVDAHGGIVVEFIGNSAADTKLLLGISGACGLESFTTLNGFYSWVEMGPFNLCRWQVLRSFLS